MQKTQGKHFSESFLSKKCYVSYSLLNYICRINVHESIAKLIQRENK